ncbi:MAG: SpoIIE family protein phosphatase [Bacteroidetes bacterium]|nr:SpoIIE family protein phosphatase [Bacteroidota bacterium]
MAKENPLKRIYDLYMSDLSYDEIERVIKQESSEVYQFFANDIPKDQGHQNKSARILIFLRNLFNAFLLKLKAGRRVFYLISLVLFILGLIRDMDGEVIVAFIIMNLLLAFELADKLTAKDELDLARKIQSDLIPKNPPENEHYEISTYYESAREVGGDYFDFITRENGSTDTYFVIGDISGKGTPAALYMIRVQAILQMLSVNFSKVKDILINLKKYFSRNLRKEYFLTIIVARISSRGSISVSSAGHNPILYYKKETNDFDLINPKGIGIGFNDKGMFEKTLEEIKLRPKSGDILFFYTDGVTETMNEQKALYGLKSVEKIISENNDLNIDLLKEKIIQSITFFRGSANKSDDLTLILLKKK